MKPSSVTNIELKFGIHVITHKIYNLSRPNNVSYEVVDLAFKVVKNNLQFGIAELQII